MAGAAPALEAPLAPHRVAGIWARHLLSLYLPLVSVLFLWTGPHRWYEAVLFIWPLVVAHQLDCGPRVERRQPAENLPEWPFDGLVYVLAALQLGIVGWLVVYYTQQAVFSLDMVLTFLIVGGSSGFSIITAHELIHRREKGHQLLGRLLLASVLYEHFYTEHLRGHHVRVGTPEDPATARFGESYEPFFRRTVPAQLRSAWRLECRRLGDPDMALLDRRQLGNRVLHGLAFEWGVAGAILAVFGLASFVAFLVQAFMAVRLLEAVNYFEHWGLVRRGARVRPVDSWDTHSWFTYYGLVGLSRHADHHAWPARPYPQLRVFEEAPLLPIGYVGLVDQVMAQNAEFQQVATEELGRRRLGPFTPPENEADARPLPREEALARLTEAQRAERRPPGRARRALGRVARTLPVPARVLAVLAAIVGVATVGVQWETGGDAMGFAARFAWNAWILAAVVGSIVLARTLRDRTDHESLSFGLAFAVLFAVGWGSEVLLRGLL